MRDDVATCPHCGASATAAESANEYAQLVLGESRCESGKQGIDWIVSLCPRCNVETLFARSPSGDVEPADQWLARLAAWTALWGLA